MHITYDAISVRDLCECGQTAVKQIGASNTAILQRMIADLRAADNLEDLPPLYNVTREESLIQIETTSMVKIVGQLRINASDKKQALKVNKVTSDA